MNEQPSDIDAVALLGEPARRALYEWVVGAGRAVSRDEAAAGTGLARALTAFHLDRLVRAELLVAEYRRLSGKTGPGAGRPAKLYRRGPREVSVSLPDRRYETAARVFAEALEALGGGRTPEPLAEAARSLGRDIGASARARAGRRPGLRRRRAALVEALGDRGYEPRETEAGQIRLGNCPFDALVEDHRDLVCGMNVSLARGLLEGLGEERLTARLDPQPGLCCVAIGPGDVQVASDPADPTS
jgi:predicted ArsR family transcriptional regulator